MAESTDSNVKDCSTSIELQSHGVAFGYEHTSIRITPTNTTHQTDPRFNQIDEQGKHYATVGAGPDFDVDMDVSCKSWQFWKDCKVDSKVKGGQELISALNRPNDVGPHPNRIPIGPKDCSQEKEVIDKLLTNDENYRDSLDYDLFPAKTPGEQSWYKPDDGYNSNSYVSGLMDSTGLEKPSIDTKTHPGWNKPVPEEHFQSRTLQPIGPALRILADKAKTSLSREARNQKMWEELEQGSQGRNFSQEPNQSVMPEEVNQSVAPGRSPGL